MYLKFRLTANFIPRKNDAQPAKCEPGLQAPAFDVFGTVVDWRGSIIREGQEWGRAKGLQVDSRKFADRWREAYMPMMDKVRKGTLRG